MNTLAKDLFVRALELPGAERNTFLMAACGDQAELRLEVQRMLVDAARAEALFGDTDGETLVGSPGSVAGDPFFGTEKNGDRIGPYKLLQQIGEGGFGTVWMAEQDKPVRRRVALKIIKLGMDTKEIVARFEQERQALAMMDHPNIARVFDAGATRQGRPFFVMELVRGVKITDYCDEQALSNEERIGLFIEVCQAVQHAHQKGIIHRDLKPSNILVTVNDGRPVPKVIDFGVAKATQGRLTDGTLFTQFEQMIGTPLYMSPEQAEMTSLDVDTRSDIYSLGVLLYELLTGRTPIDMATMAEAGMGEIRRLIREADPPRPSQRLRTLGGKELTSAAQRRHTDAAKLPGALRGDVDWIVMKCLEKDRQRRYDTANGLALDLQRHLKNEVVIARPPTAAYLLSRLIRRNKLAFAAGTAIVASLLIGIAVSRWQAVRANRALDELRATAPAFAEQARGLAAREQYDEAIEKLDYAIKLRPEAPEFLVQKGDLLQCRFKLAAAAAFYREALRVQPGLARAEASAKLCDDLLAAPPSPGGKLSHESLGKLHLAMQKQQRPAAELLPVARLLGAEKEHLVTYWLDRLKDLPISAEKPLKDRLTVLEDSLLELDLKDTQITELALLAGMPLGKLTLWNCRLIADFTPLGEFPSLTYLDLDGTQFADLSVLGDLPLKELYIGGTKVSDLSPLRGMKLDTLELHGCRLVSDLSPLVGMPLTKFYARDLANGTDFSALKSLPLEKCMIAEASVTDLSFLADTPLKELGLHNCKNLRGLNWLNELKSLERLVLPGSYRNLPADDLQAIEALRKHPRLAFIQSGEAYVSGYAAWRLFHVTQSKEIFWRDWDREQTFLPAIRHTGLEFSLTKLPYGTTYRLQIEKQPLSDLSFLKDAPISELILPNCKVADLSPIRNLPLRGLSLSGNPVADIAPLRSMPLESLRLSGSPVSDLTPLGGLPLKELYLHGCANITDVAVIAGITKLEKLTVPPQARHIEALQKLTGLRMLAFESTSAPPWIPQHMAGVFWKQYHQDSWRVKLVDAGFKPKYLKQLDNDTWEVDLSNAECRGFSDLTLLRGGAISRLNLGGTAVTDLKPLQGMDIRLLRLYNTGVTDLSPLQGMPLTLFHGSRTHVTNITPLRGMPLTIVRLHGCPNLTDLSPLAEARELTTLTLPPNARNIGFLREFRKLNRISFTEDSKSYLPDKTSDEFWKDYDHGVWLRRLREAGVTIKTSKQLSDGTWDLDLTASKLSDLSLLKDTRVSKLNLSKTRVTDLAPLRDLPLKTLNLDYTPVADLRPLANMPLEDLNLMNSRVSEVSPLKGLLLKKLQLNNTAVADLEPLRGMPLKDLAIANTKVSALEPLKSMPLEILTLSNTEVTNVSVLHGMPLRTLRLINCSKLIDLTPLAAAGALTELGLPPNAEDIGFLRGFLKLERLSYVVDPNNDWRPNMTAVEFWKEYDAKNKPANKQP